jgi:hypothetical protein
VYSSDMPPDSSSGHVHLHHNDPSIDEDAWSMDVEGCAYIYIYIFIFIFM